MRFKKLKISTGIAIVIFMLVIGNIIAFGLFKAQGSQYNIAALDTKKASASLGAASVYSGSGSGNTNSNTATQPVQQPQPQPIPQPTTVFPPVRTGAS